MQERIRSFNASTSAESWSWSWCLKEHLPNVCGLVGRESLRSTPQLRTVRRRCSLCQQGLGLGLALNAVLCWILFRNRGSHRQLSSQACQRWQSKLYSALYVYACISRLRALSRSVRVGVEIPTELLYVYVSRSPFCRSQRNHVNSMVAVMCWSTLSPATLLSVRT